MSDKDKEDKKQKDQDEELDDEDNEGRGTWKDPARELALTGLAAFFMAEDSVRKRLKDLKMPKELGGIILEGASKKKEDVYHLVAKELRSFLEKVDFGKEFSEFFKKHQIHLDAKIKFEPKTPGKGSKAKFKIEESD